MKNLTKNIRNNGIVGLVERDYMFPCSIHFAEWWNGEGLDFTITVNNENTETKISLSQDEMELLTAIFIKTGYVDIEEVNKIVEEIK